MRLRLIGTHLLIVVGRVSSTQTGVGSAGVGVPGADRGLEQTRVGG